MRFTGSYTALPTPFAGEGAERLDLAAFSALVEHQAREGSAGVVVAGTTGEAPTLTAGERRELLEAAVAATADAGGRLAVIAGVGTNCTRTTVDYARDAETAGADALLVVTPYYNRPNLSGLVAHFEAVAGASDLPIVLYNVPARTGSDMDPRAVAKIVRRVPRVVAIKEATARTDRIAALLDLDLDVLAGEDQHAAAFVRHGASGSIGVVANLLPAEHAELLRCAAPGGDAERLAELQARLLPLTRALFHETNPVPLKHALARLGRCAALVRAPLGPLAAASRAAVDAALREAGLLEAATVVA